MTKKLRMTKIVSWNLLRLTGASVEEIAELAKRESPDILLMQEATEAIDALPHHIGGSFTRSPLPGRIHGLGVWTPAPPPRAPMVLQLQRGAMFDRVCQIIHFEDFAVANVHLSHGPVLNRRQLRRIAAFLPRHAAVIGDYNLVGPPLLRGFHDVGPRRPTHVAGDIVPLRIDRCLVRGMRCISAHVLPRKSSDHKPIVMQLELLEQRLQAAA
jgi:endonuclease/exonuclease/phosphatase family metal-dependent hydrolase